MLTLLLVRFSLFFGTFDAIVLMATIYVLFPKEHPEMVQDAIQHFQWAVERFEAMSGRNSLAKAALGVLQAIYIRLKKSLGMTYCVNGSNCKAGSGRDSGSGSGPNKAGANAMMTPPGSNATNTPASSRSQPGSPTTTPTAQRHHQQTMMPQAQRQRQQQQQQQQQSFDGGSSIPSGLNPAMASGNTSDMFPLGSASGPGGGGVLDWPVPDNFDWSSIQPIYAMGDIAYNELITTQQQGGGGGGAGVGSGAGEWGVGDGKGWAPDGGDGLGCNPGAEMGPGGAEQQQQQQQQQQPTPWQFNGDFGNDSVWNLLNQYVPL